MIRASALLLASLVIAAGPVAAQKAYLSDDFLGYSGGSLTTHATLADAQAGTGVLVSNSFPQRDLSLYFGLNDSYYYPDEGSTYAYSLTNWFAVDLASSPSNTNVGFYQIYDSDGSSISGMSAFWDTSLTRYTFSASGGSTLIGCANIPPEDCGRLWNGGTMGNGGSFIDWSVDLVADFGGSAILNAASGLYEIESRPSAVAGKLAGIFFDDTTGEYYRYSADINLVSWAWDQEQYGVIYAADQVGDATSTVPEPATMTLLATGLAGLAASRRRKKV